jgi:tRNA(Ile)-lysidine synthase TilS/MesJ
MGLLRRDTIHILRTSQALSSIDAPEHHHDMTVCVQCVLPDTFPRIVFDDQARCSFCTAHGIAADRDTKAEQYRTAFLALLETTRGRYPYDALVAYSGGKDSTYTLKLLKEEYQLHLLSVTVDHGFTSPTATKNIETVTRRLDIDHYTLRPRAAMMCTLFNQSMSTDVYPAKSLERASAICNSCMSIVKALLLKMAIESSIPLIFYGWSPGQAPLRSAMFKTNPAILSMMQSTIGSALEKLIGARAQSYMLDDHHFEDSERFPTFVHPLAFMKYCEDEILKTVDGLGWIAPNDTGAHSSNCLLNDLAIEHHLKQHGFHPYAFEVANLVREGCLTRQEGLARLSATPDQSVIARVKRRLEECA